MSDGGGDNSKWAIMSVKPNPRHRGHIARVFLGMLVAISMVALAGMPVKVSETESAWMDAQSTSASFSAATLQKPQDLKCTFVNLLGLTTTSITLTWKDMPGVSFGVGYVEPDGNFVELAPEYSVEGNSHSATFRGGLLTILIGLLVGNSVELHVVPKVEQWMGPSAVATATTRGLVDGLLGAVRSCTTS